jgi:glyoxylase-like metal-dependent hydrolase (beta-lactamase superfamily II)
MLLKPGLLVRDEDDNILDARSSSTLILAGPWRIVVDTGAEDEADEITNRLGEFGLVPEDVEMVVITHDHPDHTGNNRLCAGARILSGKGDDRLGEGDFFAPGVWIMETPGHTKDSISVVCESTRRIVIAGDTIPLMGNYLKWVPPRHHVDRDLALRSMARIVEAADVVVPGHDSPFLVRERRRMADLG